MMSPTMKMPIEGVKRICILLLVLEMCIMDVDSKDIYLGCFKDNHEERMLTWIAQGDNLYRSWCHDQCHARRKIYYGLQYARECFCGNNPPIPSIHPKVDESECNMICTGDPSFHCGAAYRNSLFRDCSILPEHLHQHCSEFDCLSWTEVWCTECSPKLKYTINPSTKMCEDRCSLDQRWCWPGECAHDLAKECTCMDGFKAVISRNSAKCQPTLPPTIDSCQVTTFGVNNSEEIWSHKGSPECLLQRNAFGRFQIAYFTVVLDVHYNINISLPRPSYVESELFGVTDVEVQLHKSSLLDMNTTVSQQHLKFDPWSLQPNDSLHMRENISCTGTLLSGERMCLRFIVQAGGYFVSKDLESNSLTKVPYEKTTATKEVCYTYDRTPPIHCFEKDSCKKEPLILSTRITSSRQIRVNINGWSDPSPSIDPNRASGIDGYEISIHAVIHSNNSIKRDKDAIGSTIKLDGNQTSIDIMLPGKAFPMLYAVMLEVKDRADNVRHARRFVLFDNSSSIHKNDENPLKVDSASPTKTKQKWQINHDPLCFSWHQRFYNKMYKKHYNPLLPIDSDDYSEIQNEYDQINGVLAVNGTINKDGIIGTSFSLEKDNKLIQEGHVPDFMSEYICLSPKMSDGDTFQFQLEVKDIMNHTLNDSVQVYIDRSVPEITDAWLVKDGFEEIYVHHSEDLSRMSLNFKAYDIHSGIREVKWAFGLYENHTILLENALGVVQLNDSSNCVNYVSEDCYCPTIGQCSLTTYQANLTKIKDKIGNHNRRYFFSIKVMNNAHLISVEHVDILVDVSPPVIGVVSEGPVGSPDIDYTSLGDVYVHWQGFLDHESGIKFYRVGLAKVCLQDISKLKSGRYNSSIIIETPRTSVKLSFPAGEGQYFTTIIAFNNALSPSKTLCSDGIILDKSFPNLGNVSMEQAQIVESVGCFNEEAWLIKEDVTKTKLGSNECSDLCKNQPNDEIIAVLTDSHINSSSSTTASSFWCNNVPRYRKNVIYIPTDLFKLSWNISEDLSQISHTFIGFGSRAKDDYYPDIQDFIPIPSLTHYLQRHPGFIGMSKFYIFLKTLNRAGLENTIWFGPILADETPPICHANVKPVIHNGKTLVVKWTNKTFFDSEQTEEIGKIMFRIGTEDHFVTPFLEWNINSHGGRCGLGYQCIEYPVQRLQKYNSVMGSTFYVQMHVYNYAGHFCTVDSDNVRLTSVIVHKPGIVIDIDPDIKSTNGDVDVTFNSSVFCFRLREYKHNEFVTLHAGLGTQRNTDDVLSFYPIKPNNEQYFWKTFNGTVNKKYYITIMAKSLGGVEYSSSDGFTVLNIEDVTSTIQVHHGNVFNENCKTVTYETQNKNLNVIQMILSWRLEPGVTYSFVSRLNSSFDVKNRKNDIYVKGSFFNGSHNVVMFIPLNDVKSLFVKFFDSLVNLTISNQAQILKCDPKMQTQSSTTKIPIYWTLPERFKPLVTHFQSGICNKEDEKCHNNVEFLNSKNRYETTFFGHYAEGLYMAAVRPCFGHRCLPPAWSEEIEIKTLNEDMLDIQATAKITNSCLNISLSIENFVCSSKLDNKFAVGYRWTVKTIEQRMLADWISLMGTGNGQRQKEYACLDLPVYYHKRLFVCVEAFCVSGSVHSCIPLMIENDPNIFSKQTLYDLDLTDPFAQALKEFGHTLNIGENLVHLHDIEMDFAHTNVKMGGLLVGQSAVNVTWYLMNKRRNPPKQCSFEPSCLMEKSGTSGFVSFENNPIQVSGMYYICAVAHQKEQNHVLNVCSDGFLIDDSYPEKGEVTIESYDGFVNDGSILTVQWSGFKGNPRALDLGYPSDMSDYQLAIGTYPGIDDVVRFTDCGLSKIKTIRGLHMNNGQAYYASVKGFNHMNRSIEEYSTPVIYDNTPPSIGRVGIKFDGMTGYVSTHRFLAEWTDVKDEESGIQKIEIGVGSTNQSADMIDFRDSLEHADFSIFQDGHEYFIILKATNRAGLSSYKSSQAVMVDTSPPEVGRIMDVSSDCNATEVDVDFQTSTTSISCSWYGFHDSHSHITFFKVGLGTSPGNDDVMPFTMVGLRTSTTWKSAFSQGVQYYSTVVACNGALLCSTASSNGITIDNSAPVPGSVIVGNPGHHSKYLPDTKTLHARWIGFQDPQSSIDYFEVCVGTLPSKCDVIDPWNVSLSSAFIKSNLNMSISSKLFVTVKACNRVQLCSKRSSPSFTYDYSQPNLITKPYVQSMYKTMTDSYVILSDPSYFKIKWKFVDPESSISRTVVSMNSTRDSHVPVDEMVLTSENEISICLKFSNFLRNGDIYVIRVTSCNAASLCTTAFSDEILVDFTPPILGGFMPPLTYTINDSHHLFNLTWYGFEDMESDIKMYYISIGNTFSGNEVLENYAVLPTSNNSIHSQKIQVPVRVSDPLPDELVLIIWAKNNAGHRTNFARIRTDVFNINNNPGDLLIKKHSCNAEYCNNDCTCSAVGQKCKDGNEQTCSNIGKTSNVTVTVKLKTDHVSNAIGSAKCLRVEWVYNKVHVNDILRFEYSFGIHQSDVGHGVFDLKTQDPWQDVGMELNGSSCFNVELKHNTHYVAYVRTWISFTDYVVHESHPVIVDHTSPSVHKKHILADVVDNSEDDVDFVDTISPISASWGGLFSDEESSIDHYEASLGTSPSVDDVVQWQNVGLLTRVDWTDITIESGKKYYATVRAINKLGMQTEKSSDGFLVDDTPPDTGVVYNTKFNKDILYQSENETVGFSWHGFADQHSYIETYQVSFILNDENELLDSFQTNGLRNTISYNGKLKHNDKIMALVKALDKAGHESSVVKSQPIFIDNTPPEIMECYDFIDISYQQFIAAENEYTWAKTIHGNENDILKIRVSVDNVELQFRSYLVVNEITMVFPFTVNSDQSVVLEHTLLTPRTKLYDISVLLNELKPNSNVTVTIANCSHSTVANGESGRIMVQQIAKHSVSLCILATDQESGIRSISVGVGSVYDGFEIQSFKSILSNFHEVIHGNFTHGMKLFIKALVTNHAGLRSVFRANPIDIDHTPPILQDLKNSLKYQHIDNVTFFKVTASWKVFDKESGVKLCEYCIGLLPSSCNLISWTKTQTRTSFESDYVTVGHGSKVYGIVRCVNKVEMVKDALFVPLVVSYLPPVATESEIHLFANNIKSRQDHNVKTVTAWWREFKAETEIETYSIHVEINNSALTTWRDIGAKNYVMLNLPDISLDNKYFYKVQVKAFDTRHQATSPVNGLFSIDYTKPSLTGDTIAVQHISNDNFMVDWSGVFEQINNVKVYQLSIGSTKEATDIVMPTTTTQRFLSFSLPEKVKEIYFVVSVTMTSGLMQTYREMIRLP